MYKQQALYVLFLNPTHTLIYKRKRKTNVTNKLVLEGT